MFRPVILKKCISLLNHVKTKSGGPDHHFNTSFFPQKKKQRKIKGERGHQLFNALEVASVKGKGLDTVQGEVGTLGAAHPCAHTAMINSGVSGQRTRTSRVWKMASPAPTLAHAGCVPAAPGTPSQLSAIGLGRGWVKKWK